MNAGFMNFGHVLRKGNKLRAHELAVGPPRRHECEEHGAKQKAVANTGFMNSTASSDRETRYVPMNWRSGREKADGHWAP